MQRKEYWESICVPFDEITSNNDKYIEPAKQTLLELSISELKELNNSFFNVEYSETNETLIDRFVASERFKDYIFLLQFYKGRRTILDEFLKKPSHSAYIRESDFTTPPIPLIKAYLNNPDNLVNALLYCEFKKKQKGKAYLLTPTWTEQDTEKFEKNIRSLRMKVARKYRGKKFIEIKNFYDGDAKYFVFHRQKTQKIARTFNKNVAITGKSDVFIRISRGGTFLEIRCGDGSLIDLTLKHISATCNKKLFPETSKPLPFDIGNKIKDILTTPPENTNEIDLIIEQAYIKQTVGTPRNCIKVGKHNGPDIRRTLTKIHNQRICDLSDKSNISSFRINYNGFCTGIRIIEDEKGGFRCEFTKNNFADSKINDLKRKVLQEWGFEMGTLYAPPLREEDMKKLFDSFLDFDGMQQLTEDKKSLLQQLIDNKIVLSGTSELWRCRDNWSHFFLKEHDRCPECGGVLYLQREYDGSHMYPIGIKSYLLKMVKNVFGNTNIERKIRKYRKKTYTFLKVEYEGSAYYVFLDTGENVDRFVSYFNRSFMPTLIISVVNPVKGEIDENIFSNILLRDLYFGESTNRLKISIQNLKKNYLARIDSAAKISRSELQKMLSNNNEYNDVDLENDIFNIMKYIFKRGEKWGKELSGSPIPEAVIGYSTYYKKKKYGYKEGKVTMIWDCKHRGKEGTYDFNRDEIDKARRYIMQANSSKAVKKFSGHLNAYMTFCNAPDPTQYKNFSDALYRILPWRGSVVLFEIPALLKLYDFVKENEQLFNEKHHLFLNLFSESIEQPSDRTYIKISMEIVERLVSTMKDSNLPPNLDINSLRETFERDEFH